MIENNCKVTLEKIDNNLYKIKYHCENEPVIKIINYSITILNKDE